jgi:hypothetical protein
MAKYQNILSRLRVIETSTPDTETVTISQRKEFPSGEYTGQYSVGWFVGCSGKPVKEHVYDLPGLKRWLSDNGINYGGVQFETLDVWFDVLGGGEPFHDNQFREAMSLLRDIGERYRLRSLYDWLNIPQRAAADLEDGYNKIMGGNHA